MWNTPMPFFYNFPPFSFNQWPPFQPHSFSTHLPTQNTNTLIKTEETLQFSNCLEKGVEKEVEIKPQTFKEVTSKKKIEKIKNIKKKEKQDNFERKTQKRDRNLPSNICKFFISFLYLHPQPQEIFGKDIDSSSQSAILRCIQQVRLHIKDNQSYIRPSLIEAMCKQKVISKENSQMFRILFERFIKVEFKMFISTLRKLKKKEKTTYFRMGKKFLKNFMPHS